MRVSALRMLVFRNPGQGKPQVVPLTPMAGLSQMPFRWMFKTGWFFRYFVYANVICFPLWIYIQRKVNSPAAVAAWEAKKKADHHKEHEDHMWKDITGANANK
ncbi:unnamed protein product [Oppiella nova]|uniref:Uncharacterized protein n=1 Tax=Oppiella nova TaxID=334625 RepID=A0A7R9LH59_9ACAR|nr:unnamed protein product [Oppiella nova]CAG2163639.1 unnamed protein product [Oppiella nova]